MKKYPIITSQNKVCSVLILNQNITKNISITELWSIYKNLNRFQTKKSTINNFLIYLNILKYNITNAWTIKDHKILLFSS